MARTYGDAITALNSLQSNFQAVEAVRKNKGMNEQSIPEMNEWARRIGYEPSDFDRLRPIHIAGTKGKGSTSCFISSVLAQYLPSPQQPKPLLHKIGLFTSPHLRFVRERIQINNEPLSESTFAKYFFETWDRLEEAARKKDEATDTRAKPAYFRFLTLMALHTYMSEGVDTAVIECGMGGEYDSTNILVLPSVTGITSLGIDHTAMLGNTIDSIAWHKAGIMKKSAPCFTAPQPTEALSVLESRAEAIPTSLTVIEKKPDLENITLGLSAPFQYTNASLAVAIAQAHLSKFPSYSPPSPTSPLPPEFVRGLETVRLQGRCEVRREPHVAWHLDSGHTLESIELAASWFATCLQSSPTATAPRILFFNQQTRDANALARALYSTLSSALGDPRPFTHAVFCTNITYQNAGFKPDLQSMNADRGSVERLDVQRGLAGTWTELDGSADVAVEGTVEEAVEWCRSVAGEWAKAKGEGDGEAMVLVTGSVHLVGGFLEVFEGGGA